MNEHISFIEFVENGGISTAQGIASDWHGGQWSDLYKLSCGVYDEWTVDDIEGMIMEFGECIEQGEETDEIYEAIDELTFAAALFNLSDNSLEEN